VLKELVGVNASWKFARENIKRFALGRKVNGLMALMRVAVCRSRDRSLFHRGHPGVDPEHLILRLLVLNQQNL
jgi:hypothetical protein